MLTKVLSCQRK